VFTDRRLPAPVADLEVRAVAIGGEYNCAITTGDDLVCWGRNHFGQLGDGTTVDHHDPRVVDVPCD
jgi:alpha-tubulin suppressor-like RCC1 family protein